MRVLLLNPFHSGSHAAVAEGYSAHSRHSVTALTLSAAGGWRWRMRGAAVTLARRLQAAYGLGPAPFDLILATDMLDLATFLGLTRAQTAGIPAAVYFHENQLTYPLPPGRARDLAFPWINYTSLLASGRAFFNSAFHRRALLEALPGLTGRYHDHQELDLLARLAERAEVLYPGLDLGRLERHRPAEGPPAGPPVILWNSRWEYDKQPQVFFAALEALEARGADFRLIVAGEHIDPRAPEFVAARERFGARTLAWGYAPDAAAYARLLWQADIVVSTAAQEFFGIALLEALACGCVPVAPRRLSYPELLPPACHADCLYDDDAGLADKLAAALERLPALRAYDFRSVAAAFAWERAAPRWDAALEKAKGER
jgi:glycosyltransferase involved in cell wall biosynthesis